jgi:MoaA/NifB/PqqE/SkfB family radical SAM enzyme
VKDEIKRTKTSAVAFSKAAVERRVAGAIPFFYDQMPFTSERMSIGKRYNLLRSGLNLLHRRITPWSMPLHMQFELTNQCNLKCPVCPAGSGAVTRKPCAMDVELFRCVIDEVGPYLLTASLWAWGEPLLHPELQSILKAIRKYRIATLLSTNGQKLDDDTTIEALTAEPPTHLIVSIDGLTDETNTQFRVGGKLAPILSGVRRIAEIKRQRKQQLPILHMRFIVMKHNQHEVPGLVDFAKTNHFDMLTLRTLSTVCLESTNRIHLNLMPNQMDFRPYDFVDGKRLERKDFICLQPFWFPAVFADGTLVACEHDYNAQRSLGMINKELSFKDLWYGEHAASVRKNIRDQPETVSFCSNCPARDRDSTDASIKAYFLNDDIDFRGAI